jgi:hypothetical protein
MALNPGINNKAAAAENSPRLSRRECRALLNCVMGGHVGRNELRWPVMLEAAKRHYVAPLMASHLDLEKLPEEARCGFEQSAEDARKRADKASRALAPILDKVLPLNLPLLLFKGPVLSESLYPRRELRSFYDLDLLVRKEDIETYERAILDVGYRMARRHAKDLVWMTELQKLHTGEETLPAEATRSYYLNHHCHLPLMPLNPEQGIPIDLHWALFPRKQITLPVDDMWRRAVPMTLDGRRIVTLSRVDNLLYLCLHVSMDGYDRLRLIKLVDIALASKELTEQEWKETIALAQCYGVVKPFFMGVWLAHRAARLSLPVMVERMRPASLKRILLAAALFERPLLNRNSPLAEAAWDWALGRSNLKTVGKMCRTLARNAYRRVKHIGG